MNSTSVVPKVDLINIGLILISCIAAFIVPFELFLFAYGVLGPLHYLTEISWLHDKNYYSTNKKDVILLVIITLILTIVSLKNVLGLEELNVPGYYINRLIYISFASALFFAFIKNNFLKIVGVVLVILLSAISDNYTLFFSIFLPTLIHVFLFTSLFMLYGALKSKSKTGVLSVAFHVLCPFLLFYLFPGKIGIEVTNYGKEAYNNFLGLNVEMLKLSNEANFTSQSQLFDSVYHSTTGLAIMRFIAYAYTYHYLNWFSKTEVIKWHKVPKKRLAIIAIAWAVSLILYGIDYSLGFKWLYLLSFMHVLLEFPLNYVSFIGIFKEIKNFTLKTSTT